jgi:hypothetical protein
MHGRPACGKKEPGLPGDNRFASAKKAASAPGINASLRLHSDESHTMLPERYLQGAPLKAPDVKQ